mmetsp:Transcript_132379/g.264055  ORF Transcript_132379/g.264055 Transcript_132379/m.264055 type:complete len:230 (-) Transcript_132379:9-698(-)
MWPHKISGEYWPCAEGWVCYCVQVVFCVAGVFLGPLALESVIQQIRRRNLASTLLGESAKAADAQITYLESDHGAENDLYYCSYEFTADMPDGVACRVKVHTRSISGEAGRQLTKGCTTSVRFLSDDPSCCMLACNAENQGPCKIFQALLIALIGLALGFILAHDFMVCDSTRNGGSVTLAGLMPPLVGAFLGILWVYKKVTQTEDNGLFIGGEVTKEIIQPGNYGATA